MRLRASYLRQRQGTTLKTRRFPAYFFGVAVHLVGVHLARLSSRTTPTLLRARPLTTLRASRCRARSDTCPQSSPPPRHGGSLSASRGAHRQRSAERGQGPRSGVRKLGSDSKRCLRRRGASPAAASPVGARAAPREGGARPSARRRRGAPRGTSARPAAPRSPPARRCAACAACPPSAPPPPAASRPGWPPAAARRSPPRRGTKPPARPTAAAIAAAAAPLPLPAASPTLLATATRRCGLPARRRGGGRLLGAGPASQPPARLG